ncbi:hypothetical protein L1049_020332 [Liquidambar formosana]|uniref:ATP-dependent DNA helicase n=1 Tax=Liquidambar formosana TaxID=63359 RepID=A0AAP0S7D3_LIQFO
MLTQWFKANEKHPDARNLTYVEFPRFWVWKSEIKKWTMRLSGNMIGRLPFAHPTSGERYYFRMLLHIVRGATCYKDLRTVDGVEYLTFKDACIALGLLHDDNEWSEALLEANTWASANQLRHIFSTMLMFCEVTNPCDLWAKFWEIFVDDLHLRLRRELGNMVLELPYDELKNMALYEIENILNKSSRSLREFPSMPFPMLRERHVIVNKLIREELSYDANSLLQEFQMLYVKLNTKQLLVFDSVMHACTNNLGGLYFVYGSGGIGKTFLWQTIIAKLRSEQKIVLAVASSRIASLLLPGGRTAHSCFKIPINLHESSTCSISMQSPLAELIQKAHLIIWDEAPMIHRYAFKAVDRTFRDLMKFNGPHASDRAFGGKAVLLGGDFRQLLPVVPKKGREGIVAAHFIDRIFGQNVMFFVSLLTCVFHLINLLHYTCQIIG